MTDLVSTTPDCSGVHGDIVALLERARSATARSVNALMTATYWEIGRRIVEFEQGRQGRAVYGEALIKRLSADLSIRFGRGFYERNLEQMRSFYQAWPIERISQTASAKLAPPKKSQSLSANSVGASEARYALEGLPNKVLATVLPDEQLLAEKLEKGRRGLEAWHSGLAGDMEGGE